MSYSRLNQHPPTLLLGGWRAFGFLTFSLSLKLFWQVSCTIFIHVILLLVGYWWSLSYDECAQLKGQRLFWLKNWDMGLHPHVLQFFSQWKLILTYLKSHPHPKESTFTIKLYIYSNYLFSSHINTLINWLAILLFIQILFVGLKTRTFNKPNKLTLTLKLEINSDIICNDLFYHM